MAKETPGFLSRSKAWWELRRLRDDPSRRPPGSGPLNRALLEIDGRAAGYALYRIVQSEEDGHWKRNLRVVEAIGVDPTATREIWRFLLEVDWTDEIQAWLLPTDHPLQHLVARFDRLDLRVGTGLWVRPVDVGATLSARSYRSDSRITFELRDAFCAWNEGTWTLADGVAKRSSRRPDLRLDVQALGAAYLGGFSFAELSRAGLVEEASRGGLARADALFASEPRALVPRDLLRLPSLDRGNLPGNAQVPSGRRIYSAAGQGAAAISLAAGYSRRPPAPPSRECPFGL